jgi:hypothetical protein
VTHEIGHNGLRAENINPVRALPPYLSEPPDYSVL